MKVCFFRGKALSVNLDLEGCAVFSEYVLDVEQPSMKKVRDWIENSLIIEKILTFGMLVDASTLLRHPCLAYTANGKLAVALLVSSEHWKQFVLFDINEPLRVTIQNESQICWLTESGNIGMVTSLSILSQSDKQPDIVTTTLDDAKWLGNIQMSAIWLPDLTISSYCKPHIHMLCFESINEERKFKAFQLLASQEKLDLVENKSTENLFPTGYESSCLALDVVLMEGNQMMLVATADNRLSLFCNQVVVKSCRVPIKVQSIATAVVNKNTLALLESIDSSICIVNCHQFEIVGNYSGVVRWLAGDFTHKGHQQLIMFMSNSVEHEFVVTDFECCYLTSLSYTANSIRKQFDSNDRENEGCSKGLTQALEALQNRLVTAKVQLVDKKMLLSNKKRLLHGAAMQLPRLSTDYGSELTPRWFTDSSLVKLIGEDDKPFGKEVANECNTHKELLVVNGFQRIVYSKWVVAVEVENVSNYGLDDLVIHLVSLVGCDGSPFNCQSESYVKLKSSPGDNTRDQLETILESASKRKRLDIVKFEKEASSSSINLRADDRATLLAVMDCPSFSSVSRVMATVCVRFEINDTSKSSVCNSTQVCELESMTLHRKFVFSLQQLVDGKFTGKATSIVECCSGEHAKQDYLSYHVVASSCSLTVEVAASCVVHQVVQRIYREFGLDVGDRHTTCNMYKFVNLPERQHDVLMSMETADDDSQSFVIHVFYYSVADLSCFLCHLCQSLPLGAVVYTHVCETSTIGHLTMIDEETQRLSNFLQRLMIDSRGSDNVSLRCYLDGYKL